MPFPTMIEELEAAGYTFENDARCKCGTAIEWWNTPRGKMMPIEVDGDEIVPHWSNCPNASEFRKK